MMRVTVLDNIENPRSTAGQEWESLVQSNEHAGIMQSLHWAEFKRKQGLDCLHVVVHDDAQLIGGGIFYTATNAKGAGILVCPEGPVLPWQDEQRSEQALLLLLKCVADNAPRLQAMAVRIEPRLESAPSWVFRGFGRAPFDLVPRETMYMDLTKPEPDLLAAMHPKGRYNIATAARHGVRVQEEAFSSKTINRLYAMLLQAGRRNGFIVEPLSFFSDLAETLCPGGFAHLFFAEHEGETLGALLLPTYGERATYLYGGIGNTKRELMAGYALQWAAIKAARQAGCLTYDMYGYDQFCAPDNPYARFSRFKRQFGGQVKRFVGAHDYFFINRLADVVIKAFGELDQESSAVPAANPYVTVANKNEPDIIAVKDWQKQSGSKVVTG